MKTTSLGCFVPFAIVPFAMVMLFANCGAAPPADPELVRLEERRLMQPFEAKQTIAATNFEMDVTANFYKQIDRKIVSTWHDQFRKAEADKGTTYTYRVKVPGQNPMSFGIGNTTILVTQQMTIRVLGGRRDMTLDARGEQVTVHDASGQMQAVGRIEIHDGAFRRAR